MWWWRPGKILSCTRYGDWSSMFFAKWRNLCDAIAWRSAKSCLIQSQDSKIPSTCHIQYQQQHVTTDASAAASSKSRIEWQMTSQQQLACHKCGLLDFPCAVIYHVLVMSSLQKFYLCWNLHIVLHCFHSEFLTNQDVDDYWTVNTQFAFLIWFVFHLQQHELSLWPCISCNLLRLDYRFCFFCKERV